MKFWVSNLNQMKPEVLETWETPNCEVKGFIDVDEENFVFFRVKPSVKLSDEDFKFVTQTLKDAGGTYWFGARVWIVELSALSSAIDDIRQRFS